MGQMTIKGHKTLFDDADADLVSGYQWFLHPSGKTMYARGYQKGKPRRSVKLIYMHRLIISPLASNDIDHKNGNGLDNRRENLRECSRSHNNANRFSVVSATGVTGVHFEKWTGKWRAEVTCNGARYRLGRFDTQDMAAAAYGKKALELFGEFARRAHSSNSK